jgi:Ice-binding-like/Bacterial Ig-like domain
MKKMKNVFAIVATLLVVFLTGCQKDDDPGIRPTVTSTSPANNAISIASNSSVTATFSVAMNPATITIEEFIVKQGTTVIPGVVTYTGTTATFNPSSNLEGNTIYTGTITTGAKNKAGDGLLNNHTFSFTTGAAPDVALPVVSSTDPSSTATGVARNKTIAITFSEAMDASTITSSTFTLKKGSTSVAGAVTYTGLVASFNPTNTLDASAVYTATISTGAKDVAGNALATSTEWSFTTGGSSSSLAVVDLGAAGNYLILAKTAINNSATSALTGDLGLSPAATSYITGLGLTNATGYATSAQVTGSVFAADMAAPTPTNLTTAVNNMITAYNDAAGRLSPDFLELGTGNIGGKTLAPGLYKWTNTVTLPSNVTISGGANDVWIFQIAGNLTMSSAVNITLTGGAQAKNIFWQVAGQATFGTTSHFEGIILSMTGITLQTGASMNGRALAQTAVILDSNAVTKPAN